MAETLKQNENGKAGRQSGFSMLELIIVIAITMVLVAITARSMGSAVTSYRLNTSARNIAAEGQLAKMLASGRNTQYRVVINVSAPNTYRVENWNRTTNMFGLAPNMADMPLESGVSFLTTAVAPPPCGQSGGPDTDMIFNTRGLLIGAGGAGALPVNSRCFYLTAAVQNGYAVCATLAGKTTVYRQTGSTTSCTTAWQAQ